VYADPVRHLVIVLVALASCGSPAKEPAAPPNAAADPAPSASETAKESTPPAKQEPAAEESHSLPMYCATKEDVCFPEAAFVKRFCNGSYPDLALVLMSKDAPFTHMYLRAEVDGWNADGGGSARAHLAFDEEMLVLKRRVPPANSIVVGAGAGYLVMRWDGNCYTLEEGELTTKKPPSPKHAPLPWRYYTERTKNALLEHPKVSAALQKRGKECKGATSGDVTKACEDADKGLSAAIVSEIRSGATVPTPDRLP